MRRITVHMQTTFNQRIANGDGGFREPFPWGQEEMASPLAATRPYRRVPDPRAPGRHRRRATALRRLFDRPATDLALRLAEAKVFDAGAVVLRYDVVSPAWRAS